MIQIRRKNVKSIYHLISAHVSKVLKKYAAQKEDVENLEKEDEQLQQKSIADEIVADDQLQ